MDYDHPVFDRQAVAAQQRLASLQGDNGIWYCGSYFGYGFHEDALRSAVEVAHRLGVEVPWAQTTSPVADADADARAQPAPAWAGR
jgi:predicted NAD/FAD-binding protein